MYTLRSSLHQCYISTDSSSSHVDPVDTQLPRVNFAFWWMPYFRQWRYNGPGQQTQLLSRGVDPVTVNCFDVSPQPVITWEAIRRELRNFLSPPIQEPSLEEMIKNVAQATQRFMESAPQGHNVFHVKVVICIKCDYVVVPEEVMMRRFMELTMDDYVPRMVPATEESIKMLQYKTITGSGENNCVVCQEELSVGYEAAHMPCSHAFHGDCIKKWLRTSNNCPVCRTKMPTETSNALDRSCLL